MYRSKRDGPCGQWASDAWLNSILDRKKKVKSAVRITAKFTG